MEKFAEFYKSFEESVLLANRHIDEIELIAVSKKQPKSVVEQLIQYGHFSYGENQLQELETKWSSLKEAYSQTRLHFIGSIQSRKIRSIFQSCDVIHSIDRIKIVREIKKIEKETSQQKEYFIQINTGNEPQKSGVPLDNADSFIDECFQNQLNIKGLMCIPPAGDEPSYHFKTLKNIADNNNLKCLSMGMSNDYKTAIQCGATHIRIGTLIFGERS